MDFSMSFEADFKGRFFKQFSKNFLLFPRCRLFENFWEYFLQVKFLRRWFVKNISTNFESIFQEFFLRVFKSSSDRFFKNLLETILIDDIEGILEKYLEVSMPKFYKKLLKSISWTSMRCFPIIF